VNGGGETFMVCGWCCRDDGIAGRMGVMEFELDLIIVIANLN